MPAAMDAAAQMRVLTVRQPWAWAIIHGGKDVENRTRNLAGAYRGPVAIHVAGKYAEGGLDLPALDEACDTWCGDHACDGTLQHPWIGHVGMMIGVVDLVGVHVVDEVGCQTPTDLCSPWADTAYGTHHLVLANPRPLVAPISYRGGLGLRRLDDAVRTQLAAQVGGLS